MDRRLSSVSSAFAFFVIRAWDAVAQTLRTVMMADQPKPYRPEAYYMRGPGPKWREKQAKARGSAPR